MKVQPDKATVVFWDINLGLSRNQTQPGRATIINNYAKCNSQENYTKIKPTEGVKKNFIFMWINPYCLRYYEIWTQWLKNLGGIETNIVKFSLNVSRTKSR